MILYGRRQLALADTPPPQPPTMSLELREGATREVPLSADRVVAVLPEGGRVEAGVTLSETT